MSLAAPTNPTEERWLTREQIQEEWDLPQTIQRNRELSNKATDTIIARQVREAQIKDLREAIDEYIDGLPWQITTAKSKKKHPPKWHQKSQHG